MIKEADLAAEFSVSRTPIRQALQRLENEGLVGIRNGVGTTVTGVDFREFKDTYAFRLRLSEMIGEFGAVDRIPSVRMRIEALHPQLQGLVTEKNFENFWQINHQLHFAINDLILNSAMREIHDRLYFQASRVWYSFIDQMWDIEVEFLVEEVKELRKALSAEDLKAVGFVQRNYIAFGLARVSNYFNKT